MAGGCCCRGDGSHAQREDTEELHFDCSESVGGDVLVEWLWLVMRKCEVVVVIVICEGLFWFLIRLVVRIVRLFWI